MDFDFICRNFYAASNLKISSLTVIFYTHAIGIPN